MPTAIQRLPQGSSARSHGYEAIPDEWKRGLAKVEDLDFAYTTISLEDAYEMSYRHALELIRRGGGEVTDESVTIALQQPATVPFEDAFEGHYPSERRDLRAPESSAGDQDPFELTDSYSFSFEGIGFAILGRAEAQEGQSHVFEAELHVDGELVETATWPTEFTKRRFYLFWKYALEDGLHEVEIRLLNPSESAQALLSGIVTYGSAPLRLIERSLTSHPDFVMTRS